MKVAMMVMKQPIPIPHLRPNLSAFRAVSCHTLSQ
jgi:hypothetical protein